VQNLEKTEVCILGKKFELDKSFANLIVELLKIYCDAQVRYGDKAWNSLGEKGIFADLNRKYQRIKHYIWEDNRQMSSERIEDTLLDCAIYALLLLKSLEEENKLE
jgi:hypothetical protein